jgi:transposase-like protein
LKIKKAEAKKYFCPHCKKSFSTFTNTVFHYLEAPCEVVAWSLEFMQTFGLSLAQTKLAVERLFKFNVSVGTLSSWNRKFNATSVELPRTEFSRVWHVDEMFLKHETRFPGGKHKSFTYLWVVSDDAQRVIALLHSENRDLQAAKQVLMKARHAAGFVPRVIVSDEFAAYPRAIRAVLRGALHVQAHFKTQNFFWQGSGWSLSNNSAESLNSRLRDRLRRKRGVKSFEAAKRFFDCLQRVWNSRFVASLARALLATIPSAA